MAAKRHKPEEIVSKLRQVDVLLGQGKSRIDAIRQIGVTVFTYYRWRKNYGGMGTDQRACQRRSKTSPPGRSKTSPLNVMRYAVLGGCPGSP